MQYCNALHFCLYNYYKVQHEKVTALNLNIGWGLSTKWVQPCYKNI